MTTHAARLTSVIGSALLLGILTLSCWGNASVSLAAEPALKRFTFTEPHMGTLFKVVLYAPDEPTANQAAKLAFKRIAALDDIMSDYRSTSELMRLCRKAGEGPVPASPELFAVLEKSQQVARLSNGAFDVTVGPIVRLWRLSRRTQRLPDPTQLEEALALVGHARIQLDPRARTVTLTRAGMRLDLGGIAKGYTADEVLALLRRQGVTRALVAAGGDVVVSGPPPDANAWTIGVAPLEGLRTQPSRFLLLKDAAVSTSGDTEQFVEIDGQRYSHIVDPKTGLGLRSRSSVTVVARRGIDADAFATAVSVLGPEPGLALIEKMDDLAALVVRKTDNGEETLVSKRFAQLPQK